MTTKTEALATVEPVKSRKVGNNTFEWTDSDGNRHIRLHMTDVATFKPNGDVILNSGGWKTATTKTRITEYVPGIMVYSDGGVWYVTDGNWHSENRVPFIDGMVLKRGNVTPPTRTQQAAIAREHKRKDAINKFVAGIDELEEMPEPDTGDCWGCAMFEFRLTERPFGAASSMTCT